MIKFGEFTLDTQQEILLFQGKVLAIEPKLLGLLLLFVNQPNVIISRQDILDNLWEGSLVTDNAINKQIANLRKILGDEPKKPQYIQTVPKRGYRLVCKVTHLVNKHQTGIAESIESQNIEVEHSIKNTTSKNSFHNSVIGTTLLVLFLVLSSSFLWQAFGDNDKNSINNRYTMELTRAHGAEKSARMHPNNRHLFYLKQDGVNTHHQLWLKNIHSAKTKKIDIGKSSISKIIAIVTGPKGETTSILYLDKKQNGCSVYQASLTKNNHIKNASQSIMALKWSTPEKLFDCSDKRIKDIDYHTTRKVIYYAAQPKNFWPNQIYAFNLETKKHSFVAQTEPIGWGHHSIDISPDGNKLLIMSTNSDYKTQLLVLNLLNNEITEGVKFNYPVTQAIWHHNSEQVYYYAAPPAHQIIKSDLNGDNAETVVSVSEYLSPKMSLFPDGKNLLFSTEKKNFSNRWLVPPKQAGDIDNSTVYDTNPALFHQSSQYLFISNRSGRRQVYLASYGTKQAKIVTNFSKSYWLDYVAISADDQRVLLNTGNEVYLLPINILSDVSPLKNLKQEHLIFTSEQPIISLDWLSKTGIAITIIKNGIPELKIVNLLNKKLHQLNGKWSYGFSDNKDPEFSYLIEQQSNIVYRTKAIRFIEDVTINQHKFTQTNTSLPNGFYRVKIDTNTLYFGSDENDSVYLNVVPLNHSTKGSKYLLNHFSGYDVNDGRIMVSDLESIEGDVHRTMN